MELGNWVQLTLLNDICLFLGVSNEDIEQTKAIGWVTDIIQKGDHFKMMTRLNNRQHVNEFTLGKEANIETYTGQMFKVTINSDGPTKLVGKMEHIKTVTELKGNKLISTMTDGDIVYKSVSIKVK
eukprot:gi/632960317/ref/XP_007896130.1/ PREDICTED: fatty acid-binding protein, liver-like isoform X2 [Callorhinchus milii]